MPLDKELAEYYSTRYPQIFHSTFSNDFVQFSFQLAHSRIGLLRQYMPIGRGTKILDVGAGNAVFGEVLTGMVPEVTYDAVEPDSESRKKWGQWITRIYADLDEVKGTHFYSGVVLNEVLEHVNQPLVFLKRIHRCLESGGYIFIDVPNRDDLYKPTVEPHILFWERMSLERALLESGFEVLFSDTVGLVQGKARLFFGRAPLFQRMASRWFWVSLMNRLLRKMGTKKRVNFVGWLGLNHYGENRQWLRCVGRKIEPRW